MLLVLVGLIPYVRTGEGPSKMGWFAFLEMGDGSADTAEPDAKKRKRNWRLNRDADSVVDPLSPSFPGVILWPEAKPHVMLVSPRSLTYGRLTLDRTKPFSVPFDGVYWFLRSDTGPPPENAFVTRGSPVDRTFRTTARSVPLSMSARQNFGALIDVSCCDRIQIEIRNADAYPNTISLELTLVNTMLPGEPSQSLGRALVRSTARLTRNKEIIPARETLTFFISKDTPLQAFDEAAVSFGRDWKRRNQSVKVAIDRFVLIPRGRSSIPRRIGPITRPPQRIADQPPGALNELAGNPVYPVSADTMRGFPVRRRNPMPAELVCFNPDCPERFPIDAVLYNCPQCGALLEARYDFAPLKPAELIATWDSRRLSREPLDVSGVWRYRELLPFVDDEAHIVTLQEGNTPLLDAPRAAAYAGLDRIQFKHQGYNPSGSFKDNGMTAGVAQARSLGIKRVACVSTGNTSASMAAYAAVGDLQAVIFLPHGKIAYGKLAQALEYGALTIQVEANFDQILALVRRLAEELGIYLLNSINPFRIEGQKTIVIEMLNQRNWQVPDWIVLPGGNLGNVSALGKGLRELKQIGVIDRLPKIAVVQAEGSAPFHHLFQSGVDGTIDNVENPETLATAIRIGAPVSWEKARYEIQTSGGVVESVTEHEIADAKAVIGRSGIGCEPASAASLAGAKKLRAKGVIPADADVVGVLTGHLLKDPDYVYHYHTGELKTPAGDKLESTFGNQPVVMPNDPAKIAEFLTSRE